MRIHCTTCGHKGRIGSRKEVTRAYVMLYCQCLDTTCGHTWVANLSFSHTLKPSAQQPDALLIDLLKGLPKERQRELFETAGKQAVA